MKQKLLFIGFVLSQIISFAQQDAWVYLTDKENVSTSLQNPLTILTQRAIDRKNAHGIAIDQRDVPVNESYISQLKTQTGITVMAKSKWMNAVHVRGTQEDISLLINLSFVNYIDFADRNVTDLSRPAIQNDKFEVEGTLVNYDYGTTQNQVEMIHVNDLHISNYTGEGMLIAVLDAGFPNVNTNGVFQRLRDNNDLLDGYDFVDRTSDVYAYTGNTHGAKVLSDMGGFIQDEFVGTAPDASYYLFRTEDGGSENPVEESYWVEAAERADSLGVDIINSSLGYNIYDNSNYSYTQAEMNGQTAFISKGANIASEKGILVVNSAGNSGNNAWGIVTAPADASGVFTVAAVDMDGLYAPFSSQGSADQTSQKPDVAAQGVAAAVVDETNTIVYNSGTSFSSPIMAGAIACLWQALPNATAEEIKQYVRMSASQYNTPDYFLGYGIPNLQLALNIGLSIQEEEISKLVLYPNPVDSILYIKIPTQQDNATEVFIFDMLGKTVYTKQVSESNLTIDTSAFASGVYMVLFQTKKGQKTVKLIKS
ncbi:MAG: S8 family serine peptidase [Gelidibacter sp.]|nr:S8 family serine peptidase [Gelidibacter sp.]